MRLSVHFLPLTKRSPRSRRRRLRGAGITLELILCLPVWLIVLAAGVEFGLLMSRLQQVALAARVGAMEAAQTEGLDGFTGFPEDVAAAVDRQLQSAKRQENKIEYCRLILEHNVGTAQHSPLTQDGNTSCTCNAIPDAQMPFPACGDYVRVTVCVRMTELTPNLLSTFGLDISQKIVQHTATYRYESTELPDGDGCSSCIP
jgi:hypothetical protein